MFPRFFTSLAIATGLIAAPVFADITPDDAWNIWKAQAKALGLTLEADETREGDALQIGEMTVSATLPMDIASFSLSSDGPRFSPDGNGAVIVTMPAKMQAKFTGSITGEGSIETTFLMTRDNETLVMSGTPKAVTSRWESDGMSLHLSGLEYDGMPFDDVAITMEFGAYWAEITTSIGETLAIDYVLENDSYELEYNYLLGLGDSSVGETGSDAATGISAEFSLVLPLDGLEFMDLHNQLRDVLSLSYTSNLATYQSKQTSTLDGNVITSITQAISEYHTSLSLGRSGLGLEGSTGPIVADVAMGDVGQGMDFSFQAASIEAGLIFPLLKSDSPQDADYLMAVQDITFSPELWQLIDGGDKLDHAPMDFKLDMSGTVDIFIDLLDFAALENIKNASEVMLPASFNLDTLFLSAMGSKLTGNGAFSFDKSDMITYDGIPRPDGSLELQIDGSEALLDQLVEAGLLPEEQVLGIRMVMSLIGQPDEAEDSLTSKIEMTPDGHIIANGQRLK